jgi:hypothetical protein
MPLNELKTEEKKHSGEQKMKNPNAQPARTVRKVAAKASGSPGGPNSPLTRRRG